MTLPRPRAVNPRSEGSTGRLQALADGVFAVAMTLLAFNLPTRLGTGSLVAAVLRAGLPHLTKAGGLAGALPRGLTRVSRMFTLIPPCGFLLAIGLAWGSTWAALAVDVGLRCSRSPASRIASSTC